MAETSALLPKICPLRDILFVSPEPVNGSIYAAKGRPMGGFRDNIKQREEEAIALLKQQQEARLRSERAEQTGPALPSLEDVKQQLNRRSIYPEVALEVIVGKPEAGALLLAQYEKGWRVAHWAVLPKNLPDKKVGAEYHLLLNSVR